MEQGNSSNSDEEEQKANQRKLKAQEIAKRYEKYQSRYQSSSSRCNTPLPSTLTDSMESIYNNSILTDTSEKLVKFRQFLENDRKLVENCKIDEQKYDTDNETNEEKLLQSHNEKVKPKTNYENFISDIIQEKHIQSLKNQVVELNKKLENYQNIISDKDEQLQLKNLDIESLNKVIMKKYKSHLENIRMLEKRYEDAIYEEQAKYHEEVTRLNESLFHLKHKFEYIHDLYEKSNNEIKALMNGNNELKNHNIQLLSEHEEMVKKFENGEQKNLDMGCEYSKEMIDEIKAELANLQQENDLLINRIQLLEKESINKQEKDLLLSQLDDKETKLVNLQQEYDLLMDRISLLEQECKNTQEKDNFQDKDKKITDIQQEYDILSDRMTLLESTNNQDKENLLYQFNNNETKLSNIQKEYDLLMNRLTLIESSNNQERENLLYQLNDKEIKLGNLQQENDLLTSRISLLESELLNTEEKDNLLYQINDKESKLVHIQHEYDLLTNRITLLESSHYQEREKLLYQLNDEKTKLENLQQENELLMSRISLLENEPQNTEEKDNLLYQINDKETKLINFQQENSLLMNRITLFETEKENLLSLLKDKDTKLDNIQHDYDILTNRITLLDSTNIQQRENILHEINVKDAEIQRLNLENENLTKQLKNQVIESQTTENRWIQLKDAYLNDRDRMSFLEKVIEELKMNNDELSNENVKLNENIEKTMTNLTNLKTENSHHQARITDLSSVIENMHEKFEKTMKESSNEYELNIKQLIQQHQNDTTLLATCNNKLEQNTLELNEVTNQLENVLKENDTYKCELLKLNNYVCKNDKQIWDLNNIINELHKQTSQMEILQKENVSLSNKLNGTNFETEDGKLLLERFQKQKQLLKVKMKALKESESNCLLLQQKVVNLTEEIQISKQKSEDLIQNNKQCKTVLQHCDMELQKCYDLLNNILMKSNIQNQNIYTFRVVLMNLASLFSFNENNVEFDTDLLKTVDSICNSIPNDNDLHVYLKNIVLGSIHMLEYIVNLNNQKINSKAQSIAYKEVEELVSDAVEKVKLSTQIDNHSLKLNTNFDTKEVLTDLNGPIIERLLSTNLDVKNINNNIIIQILNNLRKKLCSINFNETDHEQIMNSLTELELNINSKKHSEDKDKLSFISESLSETSSKIDSITIQDDSKILLPRYKNLKTRYKESRAKIVELDKKILSLTNDLDCVNIKYQQLHDKYIKDNEIHETDIANYQYEIENLMSEKLEACRELRTLKDKHEILQNDYKQIKSNLDNINTLSDTETSCTQINEQNTILKGKLDDIQRLIDSTYLRVLCKSPPIDTNCDWIILQSNKLDTIVNVKCNNDEYKFNDSEVKGSVVDQLQKCNQIVHEIVSSTLTNYHTIEVSSTDALVDLMSDLKSCTETFLEFIFKNNESNLVNENDTEIFKKDEDCKNATEINSNFEDTKKFLKENEENQQFQRSIAERDRLIEFLSDKISKLNNLNKNVDDIKTVREKLDRALTAVHDRDVRCDELTLELTRLLEERDMLQLKLSNSIRQVQLLSDNKPQFGDKSNMLKEKCGLKTMDDKLEELHSLEYRRDADLFNDQEQRHISQMELHQHEYHGSTTQEAKSSNITEETNNSLSWIKDILW